MADLKLLNNKIVDIPAHCVVVIAIIKNEMDILRAFLEHYRRLGVRHFVILDNNSTDGSPDFLKLQDDVILYSTTESYRTSFDGILWTNDLADRHCTNRWTLVVDADEFLVLPPVAQTLPEMARYLERHLDTGLYCPMVDFYAGDLRKSAPPQYGSFEQLLEAAPLVMPFAEEHARQVASYPYFEINIKGGLRGFMTGRKTDSPRLNKIPLVYWHPGYRFVKSTHEGTALPLSFTNGVLCHFKYRPGFVERMDNEINKLDRQDAGTIELTREAKKGTLPHELRKLARSIEKTADLATAGWLPADDAETQHASSDMVTFPRLWKENNRTKQTFFPPLTGAGDNGQAADRAPLSKAITTVKIAEKFQHRQVNNLSFSVTRKIRIWLYRRGWLPPEYVPELVDHPGGPVESMVSIYESLWWAIAAPFRLFNRIYKALCWRKLFSFFKM